MFLVCYSTLVQIHVGGGGWLSADGGYQLRIVSCKWIHNSSLLESPFPQSLVRLQSLCFLLLSSNVQLSAMSFGLICRNVDRSQSVFYFVPQAGSTTEMWSSWTESLMYLCAFNVFLCLIFHFIVDVHFPHIQFCSCFWWWGKKRGVV